MTRSMSYSRYFKTATAMAVYRHTSARQDSSFSAETGALATAGLNPVCGARASGMIAATTSRAAIANHFSCSLSSPEDLANRAATAPAPASRAAGTKIRTAVCDPGYHPSPGAVNGSAHMRQARATWAAASSVNTAATNHGAGRHRREASRPVGNSRSVNASPAAGICQAQFTNHAAGLAPGSDPGAAISPRCPYRWQNKPRPSTRPEPRIIQPILFPGRLDVRTNPTAGMAMNVASSKTEEKSQPLAGTRCRSRYDSAIAPASSATDTDATQPVAHGRARTVVRALRSELRRWPTSTAQGMSPSPLEPIMRARHW